MGYCFHLWFDTSEGKQNKTEIDMLHEGMTDNNIPDNDMSDETGETVTDTRYLKQTNHK